MISPKPDSRMPMGTPIDRRSFFGAAGIGAAALATGTAGAARVSSQPGRRAKHVILMVSDGMSTGTLSLADMMHREQTGEPSRWCALWDRPGVRRSMVRTSSADSLVTDSAAAATAWSVGVRVNNGAICHTPDGDEPTPILVRAKQAGKMTGLVTTTRVTHATPAAFIANVPIRSLEDPIAKQMVERGVDVILGGGAKHFPDELLDAHADLTVVRDATQLAAAPRNGRLLGLFSDDHVPFVLDRNENIPSLETMTRAALDRLGDAPGGSVLQIEAGRVDHAAHANDAGALVQEQLEFDRAIGVVLEHLADRDDTLLLVTTDHANANPGLTIYGEGGNAGFERLRHATKSFEWIFGQLRTTQSRAEAVGRLPELLTQASGGYEPSESDIAWLRRGLVEGARVDGFLARNRDPNCTLGSLLANHYGVSFLSPNHSADHVELTAWGPGAERVAPVSELADLHGVIAAALGLTPTT